MTDLILPRRQFLTGMMGIIAAPAVVKASSLMPVRVIEQTWEYTEISYGMTVKRSTISLAELREILMPGLQKIVDGMYEDRSAQWEGIFRRVT